MSEEQEESNNGAKGIVWYPVVALFFAVVVVGFYSSQFHDGLSNEQGMWGVFGDYVGGVLNPVVGLITIVLLVKTLLLNHEELRLTRKEMRRARIEHKKTAGALNKQAEHMVDQSKIDGLYRSIQLAYSDLLDISKQEVLFVPQDDLCTLSAFIRANSGADIKRKYEDSQESAYAPIAQSVHIMSEYLIVLGELVNMFLKWEAVTNDNSLSDYFRKRLYIYTCELDYADLLEPEETAFYVDPIKEANIVE